MKIKNKRTFYNLSLKGSVGNSPKTWACIGHFLLDKPKENIGIGIRDTKPGSKKFRYNVPQKKLFKTIKNLGLKNGSYFLTISIPKEETLIAGELGWFLGDWYLYYSRMKEPMRKALNLDGKHLYGYIKVWNTLKRYCTLQDLEELKNLFDFYTSKEMYPVIEFTVTKKDWGIFPNRNLVVWEVRHY